MTGQRKVAPDLSKYDTFINDKVSEWKSAVEKQGGNLKEVELAWVCRYSNWVDLKEKIAPTSEPVKAHEQEGVEEIEHIFLDFRIGCKLCDRFYDKNNEHCLLTDCGCMRRYIGKFQSLITSRIAEAVREERERIAKSICNIPKLGNSMQSKAYYEGLRKALAIIKSQG